MRHGSHHRYRRRITSGLVVLVVSLGTNVLAQPVPVAIHDVTVIDGISTEPLENATVIFHRGIITAVGPSLDIDIPEGSSTVDGNGQYLIPGLWDTHAHLTYWGEDALDSLIQAGVTSIRELGGDVDLVEKWKGEVEAGSRVGPNMIWSGPYLEGIDAPDEYRLKVADESEARQAVNDLLDRGIDFIKIQAVISAELVAVLVDEAQKRGSFVVGHVPRGLSAAEASSLGLRSIEHMGPYLRLSEEDLQATIETFLKNDTWLSPALFSMVAPILARGEDPSSNDVVQRSNAIVLKMHEAGVPLLVGANFAYRNWPQRPGSGLHGEMHSLVDAGLSPMDVLILSTSRAAEFNGMSGRSGAIEVGLAADLVLLEEDPLADIRNTRKIAAVFLNGREIIRD